ncbi:MAG TPA: divalent metal cation transporter [Candidatus Eisenbacteria bacterium]|nr:divalent metal cation transporter [Candidatus Eisenbacteria bacterium]
MKGILKKALIFFGVLGPSVITTMAGNDGAGVITYSMAGASFGYAMLITLPFLTFLYAITQEMGSRVAIVSGKGLGDIIRERFGIRIATLVFILIIVANFGTLLTDFAALKLAGTMLNIPVIPLIAITILFCFLLVTFSNYEKSQKVFLTGIVFYLAYLFSAMKASPDWGSTVTHLIIPDNSIFTKGFLIASMAVLGTTITPWGQFFVQSYMKDKNVSSDRLGYAKLEAFLGAFLSNFFTYFMMVATAATLFLHKIPLTSGEQAALAIKPFVGNLASTFFAIGLINAAIIGIVIISLTSAYAFSEFFGFSGSLDDPYNKGKTFYTIFLLSMIFPALLVITPLFPLFAIVLYTQSLNGILLPIFFFFLLKIVNDKNLMGKYVNGRIYNFVAIGSTILIVIAALVTIVYGIIPNL